MILSHGLGDSQSTMRFYAQNLAQDGYLAVTFNFNHGTVSDDMTKMSIFTEEDDLNSVIKYIKVRHTGSLYLVGASQGGVVTAMTVADRSDIKGIALLYPAFVLRDEMLERFGNQTTNYPETFNLMGMTLGKEYLEKLPDYDLLKEVTRYQGPVLIIHGTSDTIAPISYSEEVSQQYQRSKLVKLKDTGHGFYGQDLRAAQKEIRAFFNKH